LAPSTYDMHAACIREFLNFEYEPGKKTGSIPYRDLKIDHLQRWVVHGKQQGGTQRRRWSDNYADLRLRILRTAFKWAAHEGELVGGGVSAGRGRRARLGGADLTLKRSAITEAEHEALLAQARRRKRGDFGAVLELLSHRGASTTSRYLPATVRAC